MHTTAQETPKSWLNLISSTDRDAATWYDLMGTSNVMTSPSGLPCINMGYWAEAAPPGVDPLEHANLAMFDLVAGKAGLSESDGHVLDVGCGFGAFAQRCARNYGVQRVTGLNLSQVQLEFGRAQIAAEGLSRQVDLMRANATEMPFEDGSVDKVLSVEAAFHFYRREDFFREAFRVLRPGGVLALADLVAPPPRSLLQRLRAFHLSRALQMPSVNFIDLDGYSAQVRSAGFEIVQNENIRDQVFPSYEGWIDRHWRQILGSFELRFSLANLGYFSYPWSYVMVVARKPLSR